MGALKESKLVIQQTDEEDFGTYQVVNIYIHTIMHQCTSMECMMIGSVAKLLLLVNHITMNCVSSAQIILI